MRRQADCKHDYVAPFLVLRSSSSVKVTSFASRIKTPYNFVTHPVLQVVRAASFLGCDNLSQEEAWVHLLLAVRYATWKYPQADLWNRLGTETSHDQHV